MAQTIDYWYKQILAEKSRQTALNGITSTSKVSTFGLIGYTVSFIAWLLETFFDKHKSEVAGIIRRDKPHQQEWYQTLAMSFQFGQAFNKQLGKYENIGLTDAQIAAQKIIAQVAVNEVDTPTSVELRVLVAKVIGNDIGELLAPELAALNAYLDKTKDAGVNVNAYSFPADALKLDLDIFYDPLVLTNSGSRIDGAANTPVMDAINDYLRDPLLLPFNGEYANSRLADTLQKVEGVVLPVINTAWAKFGLHAFTVIDERYIPNGGYIRLLPADLTINWRPYV